VRIDEAKDCTSDSIGVGARSSSRVKKYGEGADASGGSGSSSSEAMDWVVVTDAIVSSETRRLRCGGRRLLARNDLSRAGERWGTGGGTGSGAGSGADLDPPT
jgi:hypothetical protein